LVAREVFEVLYSPVKAFKKIIEKPDFKGVLLILVLVMFSTVVSQYAVASKFFVRPETPDDDDWTESLANQHNWTSNGSPSLDETDYKMGNTVGNHSIRSEVFNDTSIWMKITGLGPFDCSGDTGYEELFFWIKWIHQDGTSPTNATLRLFSESESSYFESNLTDLISTSNDTWTNATLNGATLKIGPGQSWDPIDSPKWESITGLEFRLAWLVPANLTMKIDDLHFRKYVPFLETGAFSGIIIYTLMSVAIVFFMNWILWAGILLLTIKFFHEKGGPWTTFFIIIGHVFIVTVVYELASAALFSALPTLNLPMKALPATEEEANAFSALIEKRWHPNWAYWGYGLLSGFYFPFVREVWVVALCVIAVYLLCKITWKKAAGISLTAFLLRTALRLFIGF